MDLRRIPPELLIGAAVAAVLLAAIQTLRLVAQSWWRRRRIEIRRVRGAAGEVRAEALLRARGYAILGRQVAVSWDVCVDGEPIAINLRADYLVSMDGRRYVAEVKTGKVAPSIAAPTTRRQLLEYRLAFDVDGALLVDAETDRVHTVEFPLSGPPSSAGAGWLGWLLAGLVAGAGATCAAWLAR